MAQCQLGAHGICNSCDEPVNRTQEHIHFFRPNKNPAHQLLCRDCANVAFTAASFLLRGIQAYTDKTGDTISLTELIEKDRLVIGIDQPMF